MMMNEIWNKRIDCGSRTYFFDMKETKEGKKILQLRRQDFVKE
jgi:hypothetical protein